MNGYKTEGGVQDGAGFSRSIGMIPLHSCSPKSLFTSKLNSYYVLLYKQLTDIPLFLKFVVIEHQGSLAKELTIPGQFCPFPLWFLRSFINVSSFKCPVCIVVSFKNLVCLNVSPIRATCCAHHNVLYLNTLIAK